MVGDSLEGGFLLCGQAAWVSGDHLHGWMRRVPDVPKLFVHQIQGLCISVPLFSFAGTWSHKWGQGQCQLWEEVVSNGGEHQHSQLCTLGFLPFSELHHESMAAGCSSENCKYSVLLIWHYYCSASSTGTVGWGELWEGGEGEAWLYAYAFHHLLGNEDLKWLFHSSSLSLCFEVSAMSFSFSHVIRWPLRLDCGP